MKKILIKLVVCLSFVVWTVPLSAQVTVDIDSMPLTEALKKLEEQTGYSFFYSNVLPDKDAVVSVKANNKDIAAVMDQLLDGLAVSYKINEDKQIALYAANNVFRSHCSHHTIRLFNHLYTHPYLHHVYCGNFYKRTHHNTKGLRRFIKFFRNIIFTLQWGQK